MLRGFYRAVGTLSALAFTVPQDAALMVKEKHTSRAKARDSKSPSVCAGFSVAYRR